MNNEFFQNINKINPNLLILKFKYGVTEEFDYIRILKNIKSTINIDFWKYFSLDSCQLSFTNTPIIIKSNYHEPLFIRWKSFLWYADISKLNIDFWFSKNEDNKISNRNQTFLHFIHSLECIVHNWERIWDKEEIKRIQSNFSSNILISDHEYEFVIPMRFLDYVDISDEQISKIINNDNKSTLIEEISEAKKISCSLNFITGLSNLEQWRSLLPWKCTYSLTQYSKTIDEINYGINSISSTVESLSLIHISCIYIIILLSEENYLLMREILSSSDIKFYLTTIKLVLRNLSNAIDILELLSECKYVESVDLQYASLEDNFIF